MSINAIHVVRNGFRNLNDRNAVSSFALQTIEQLKERLFIHGVDNLFHFEIEQFEEYSSCFFYLPYYNLWLSLYNGCWEVYSLFSYNRLTSHINNYFPARCCAFDIVRTLGKKEAWHASEEYSNDMMCDGFESWSNFAKEQLRREEYDDRHLTEIPEFNCNDILASGGEDGSYYEYVNAYHDDFKECFERFQCLQDNLKDMELLGLYRVGNSFLRCKKDGGLFLVNEETLQPLFDEPVDWCT